MLQVSRLERNEADNNNLFHKGKYHCLADLLFDRFGFDKQVNLLFIQQNQRSGIQTKKQEVRRTVILPLMSFIEIRKRVK